MYRAVRSTDHLSVIVKVLDPKRCCPKDLDRQRSSDADGEAPLRGPRSPGVGPWPCCPLSHLPSEVVPQVPETIAHIVLKLLAKRVEERYQSARGLQHDGERRWSSCRWDSPHPASRVLRSGEPLLVPEVSDSQLWNLCEDDEHFRLIRELGSRTGLAVPLVASQGSRDRHQPGPPVPPLRPLRARGLSEALRWTRSRAVHRAGATFTVKLPCAYTLYETDHATVAQKGISPKRRRRFFSIRASV
jgi:hypothetical protein